MDFDESSPAKLPLPPSPLLFSIKPRQTKSRSQTLTSSPAVRSKVSRTLFEDTRRVLVSLYLQPRFLASSVSLQHVVKTTGSNYARLISYSNPRMITAISELGAHLLVRIILLLLLAVAGCTATGSTAPDQTDAALPDLQIGDDDATFDAAVDMMPELSDVSPTLDAHANLRVDARVDFADISSVDAELTLDLGVLADAQALSDMSSNPADATDIGNASLDERITDILAEFGLTSMRTRLPTAEIETQASNYGGTIEFTTALRAALNSFLDDDTDAESPRSLATDVRTGPCLDDDIRERVRCFLNRGTAYLELYGDEGFAPEERESVDANWVFILRAESLSDHIQWAIVDRNGVQPTYNYGFN